MPCSSFSSSFSFGFFCFCFCLGLFTSFFMKCIHHVCECVLLKSAFDYWYWWLMLASFADWNKYAKHVFYYNKMQRKKTFETQKKKREKKTSEISANHVESCTHKCACTKRIFTRQQRHTHDTRRRRQRRCKQWKMVMEHFSNWAYQTPAIYPRWMAHQQKTKKKRRTRTSYAFHLLKLINK